jgi:hypothetical protein
MTSATFNAQRGSKIRDRMRFGEFAGPSASTPGDLAIVTSRKFALPVGLGTDSTQPPLTGVCRLYCQCSTSLESLPPGGVGLTKPTPVGVGLRLSCSCTSQFNPLRGSLMRMLMTGSTAARGKRKRSSEDEDVSMFLGPESAATVVLCKVRTSKNAKRMQRPNSVVRAFSIRTRKGVSRDSQDFAIKV